MNIHNLTLLRTEILTRKKFHFNMTKGCKFDPVPEQDEAGRRSDWCGTTGCIAGLAYFLALSPDALRARAIKALEMYAESRDEDDLEVDWEVVRDTALQWLDLTPIYTRFGHELFDSDLSGHITKEAAVAAIDRVIAGQEPWPETEDRGP